MKQFTKEEAIAFYENKLWEPLSQGQRALLQLEQDLLCMPFNVFHAALEYALGRPVWTHELVARESLMAELKGKKDAPTMDEILSLLPKGQLVIIEL